MTITEIPRSLPLALYQHAFKDAPSGYSQCKLADHLSFWAESIQ